MPGSRYLVRSVATFTDAPKHHFTTVVLDNSGTLAPLSTATASVNSDLQAAAKQYVHSVNTPERLGVGGRAEASGATAASTIVSLWMNQKT